MGCTMVKYNPANKATQGSPDEGDDDGSMEEQRSTSDTVNQMLDNYNEIKERTTRSISETEAYERLPEGAQIRDGKLWVPDRRYSSEYERDMLSFTEAKRQALLTKLENPDASNVEIANEIGHSNSLVGRALNHFGFLLDDPVLLHGFVYQGITSSDYWTVEVGNKVFSFPSREVAEEYVANNWSDSDVVVCSPEDEEVQLSGESEESQPEESQESQESEVEDDTEDEDAEDSGVYVPVSLSLEEIRTLIIDTDDEELQSKLLRQVYEQ